MDQQAEEQLVIRLQEIESQLTDLIYAVQSHRWGKVLGVRDRKKIGVIASLLNQTGQSLSTVIDSLLGVDPVEEIVPSYEDLLEQDNLPGLPNEQED